MAPMVAPVPQDAESARLAASHKAKLMAAKTHTVMIDGMKCATGCVANIKSILGKIEGVEKVMVDFDKKTVKVIGEKFDRAAVIGKLVEAGYKVTKWNDEAISS